jgi:hypothetical protein
VGRTFVPSHRRVLVGLVALTLVLLPGTAIAAENDGADYGVRPAPVGDGSRPIDHIEHALEPAASITDAIQIFNFGEDTAVFDIYPADMVPTSNGGMAPAARDAEIVAEGSWLTVDTETVELGPGDWATVGFDIVVPLEASIGEHETVVLVERHEPPGTGMVDVRTRVGLLVQIEVLSQIDLAASLGALSWARDGGDVTFSVPISNTGDVTFAASGVVHITDGDGDEIAAVTLLPDGRYVAADEDAVLEARWEDPPLFGRFEAEAVVEASVGDRAPVVFEGEPLSLWLVPWVGIFVTLGVLATIIWIFYNLRPQLQKRARHRREEKAMLRDFRRRRALEEESPKHASPRSYVQ